MSRTFKTLEGNEALAHVAYRTNEVISIYPITPASNMGEYSDAWAAEGLENIWGSVPLIDEMQSEAGAIAAVHGAIQTGALSTTFTAAQGLLLMPPTMYKIAGELTPCTIHVSARSLAAQALSIFGDHGDVMAVRGTGFALLASCSGQEVMDLALVSEAATLKSRIPFLHFFDGFRTSHEITKIEVLSDDDIRSMIDDDLVIAHRNRRMSPDKPIIRGTSQNPDVYFQGRETVNRYYAACPEIVEEYMRRFEKLTGRKYELFQYYGAPDAERVIVMMGSGAETALETVNYLNKQGEKVGLVKVRLYRPFSVDHFVRSLPSSVKAIAVLDRLKEPGSAGEPLYLDVVNAIHEGINNNTISFDPEIVGGRYGLSSKEFTPAMVKAIFENLAEETPKNHFTIGINDDVMHTSLPYDANFSIEPEEVFRAMFYGLGSDGTVGANKNTIKIIGENTDNYAQGYFVYDSKKAGSITVSHLRFGPNEIHSTYKISNAQFIGCHHFIFLQSIDIVKNLHEGGTLLINSHYGPDEVWDHLPKMVQQQLIDKKAKLYTIDAYKVAHDSHMGQRINTIMQACFFAISGVLPREEAIEKIKQSIRDTYGKKGDDIVNQNIQAVENTLSNLHEVKIGSVADSKIQMRPPISGEAPEFVCNTLARIIAGEGDDVPVSQMPADGTFPVGTSKFEKRNLAQEVPVWEPDICIQCGKCSIVCPHAVIRSKAYDPKYLEHAPSTFKCADAKGKRWEGLKYTIQVAVEDCTGCEICVNVCPARDKQNPDRHALNMSAQEPLRENEVDNWNYFLHIPEFDRSKINTRLVKEQQLQQPLFEFHGACAGCGETQYVKLMSQLFGDRLVLGNATGCSSIYGGNLPTTPYCTNADGLGPTWSNSLFEDTAEFALGFRISINKQKEYAEELVRTLSADIGETLTQEILEATQNSEPEIFEQRKRISALKEKLEQSDRPEAKNLLAIADMLVKKSVWAIGGDGWAYDIGYSGVDHVTASGENVNMIVLDTEVYSNTGGQASKATPKAAVAKFAAAGRPVTKKDLGMISMSYGNAYVASVALGARDEQTLKAFIEAEAYNGPSIIIAYSHCIAHGIDMSKGMEHQKTAVDSGHWLLYRYNPERLNEGKNPLILDSKKPKIPVEEFLNTENRFRMLKKSHPDLAKQYFEAIQKEVDARYATYEYLAARKYPND
ncbi:pyruvate:ferredoxin (flavodoxin) oxidoreductase [Prosthecochloris sp. N3]|uniref:Pyruvate:ferredoxin (Flavodoxin) oxidoreductase n=1 Tax=Prosthecochloris ethylica TaxID=2743976 RepID=A0ABR9XQ89_9CHLB|nr:pyruvate:ferredoxin (flavodoxin) oxidoreductase [Prosthecochloris ethylica]MBF0586491.1 pyruvate:ferredoxin (flavodoxin) oxidoreductase [Prosthecochloris ethylica]MBF0636104.1 pyruvate:ferredoxin (flavodoxin) oxidoreductase [Prosthecochloris ethylica]NUK47759.1 pyruvate:ferredoxin (flavodoxin) oxidoreductase [Prosthecochloris ethylica]